MSSFNDPKLSNHIADDVPAIRQLLRSVATLDPATGNTNIPNGAKRLVETAQGYEFQSYNGKGWVTLEKWNLDVQKVDGYSASTGTTASTIPVRDTSGKLPGDITGNAATASEAVALSATNPIARGGTGATTAEQARENLGTPPKSHASGATEYGAGSSTQYGHLKTHDSPDATLTADTGNAFTPAGAAALHETINKEIDGLAEKVGTIREDTLAAVKQATASGSWGVSGSVPLPDPETVVHAMGEFWFTLDGSIPSGGLPHLGHLCSRATYGDFWTWREVKGGILTDEDWLAYAEANGGVCPYYSYGDGSTTFRTPKYDEAFLKVVAATANAGKYGAEGLPNIHGAFADKGMEETIASGLFNVHTAVNTGRFTHATATGGSSTGVDFDASRVNPIYGNSNHVTPKNVGVLVGVYAVGKLGVIGSTDAENLLAGVTMLEANKASVDASNFSVDGKSMLAGLGMPSGRYVNVTLGASDTRYVAPANGYFASTATITDSSFGLLDLRHAETNLGCTAGASGSGKVVRVILPVLKDSVVVLLWNSPVSVGRFIFIYADGDE